MLQVYEKTIEIVSLFIRHFFLWLIVKKERPFLRASSLALPLFYAFLLEKLGSQLAFKLRVNRKGEKIN